MFRPLKVEHYGTIWNIARRGFTLIEVTAVLALTALLAAAAVVSLAGPRARSTAADAVGQLAFADGQVRRAAAASGRSQAFVIDLAHGRLSRSTDDSSGTPLADLPAGVRVERVLTAADTVDAGTVRIDVTPAGRGRSYAIGLSTPAGARWTVIAGLTGRATAVADERAAAAAIDLTRGEP